ncbi:CgeB family protein [Bradyrhizobium retamae]|uniref:Glycosyltransferase n=1 Tax=Bradyrhizobium retamae TaxID=1300035 RepID=A0A0R3NCK6_9BRAD|nr:glycosyltransferase [Bradyrhizobium retamae]KRR27619.1 glycosyltransferase [Bradyrhizobium retamae]
MKLDIVMFGLSITSSWGNGHATTYRALTKALAARGHRITFLERDVPWYRDNRDLRSAPYCRIKLYDSLRRVSQQYGAMVAGADVVVLGSFVPDGIALGDWITSTARGVTIFYDIDTPVTISKLTDNSAEYISPSLIPRFNMYLSFTGGPTLQLIKGIYGSPRAYALYCAADVNIHKPVEVPKQWMLGYIGTYSEDRQPLLEQLLIEPARRLPEHRFVVVGPQYPGTLNWPANVEYIEHLPPGAHSKFYCSLHYALNLTRQHMAAAGYSPSVRLFEAAACGVPVISDIWPGIDDFFTPEDEILLAADSDDVVKILSGTSEIRRRALAAAARDRALKSHTAENRALEFERYVREVIDRPARIAPIEAVRARV